VGATDGALDGVDVATAGGLLGSMLGINESEGTGLGTRDGKGELEGR